MKFMCASVFARLVLLALVVSPLWAQSDRISSLHEEASAAEAQGDLSTAIEKYREILKLDPSLGPAYNNLGALYVRTGQFRDGAEVLQKGLKVAPGMSSAAALLGICFYETGEYGKARPYLEAAVKAHPGDDKARFLLINDLTKLGDFESALAHLQQLSKREPQNAHVLYLLGRVYMQLSEQTLGKLNQVDPNSVWSHEISAELMESMKNYDGAIVEYKKAIEIAPNQPGVHYKLGDLYWSLSQWDNAAQQFEQEQKIDPHNCMVYWKLGNILMQKSVEPEKALSQIDRALAGCPNLADAHTDRGRLLLKLHREREAIPELAAAEKAAPGEPSNHFLLAQAYRATGQSEQARAEMKLFSELEQKSRNAMAERANEVIQNNQAAH